MNEKLNSIAIITAHEGSLSWTYTVQKIAEKFKILKTFSIINDNEYRASTFKSRILNRIKIYILFPLKIILSRKKSQS